MGGDTAGFGAVLGTRWVAECDGVEGPDDAGESGSVTHNLYNIRFCIVRYGSWMLTDVIW